MFTRAPLSAPFLVLLAAVSIAAPRAALAADIAGNVEAAEGRSTGLLEGTLRELAAGAEVFLLEIVETGAASRLQIALGEDTQLRLGERTRITIEQTLVDQGGKMVLERGAMLFEHAGSGPSDVTVSTPFAVIAARGTTFWTGPSNDVVGVFVQEGIVEVANNGGSVILEAGQGTDLVSFDVAPTSPREWGAPRIEAALATVN
jgi:ferric-dicitrate binding protein FerR (iron transport regulator)